MMLQHSMEKDIKATVREYTTSKASPEQLIWLSYGSILQLHKNMGAVESDLKYIFSMWNMDVLRFVIKQAIVITRIILPTPPYYKIREHAPTFFATC